MDRPRFSEINPESKFARAAAPVLERMGLEIADERLSIMLVDDCARMLTTVNGCSATDAATQRLGAVPGAVWHEATTGTNALATPFETRQPIFIRGREHYVDALKAYSCYGTPIFNPFSGRLEGVLDVMSDAGAENALMRSFINSAAAEIQQNLKANSGRRTLALVAAFEEVAKHHAVAVVGLSQSMILQSTAAAGLLSSADIRALHDAVGDADSGSLRLALTNGQNAVARFEKVDGSEGVLVRLQARRRSAVPRSAAPVGQRRRVRMWCERFRAESDCAVVIGETGTGRTTVLTEAVRTQQSCWIQPAGRDPAQIESGLSLALRQHADEVLVIEDLDLLNARSLALVEEALSGGWRRILASSTPARSHESAHARVLGSFPLRLEMPPLRGLRSELDDVIAEIAGPGVRYRFTSGAARVIESYAWPGNWTELAAVIKSLSRKRGTLIDLPDLPAYLRNKSTTKSLTPWQQANRDAIVNALDRMHGNKAHAADFLGISRSTLYHHIRECGIHA